MMNCGHAEARRPLKWSSAILHGGTLRTLGPAKPFNLCQAPVCCTAVTFPAVLTLYPGVLGEFEWSTAPRWTGSNPHCHLRLLALLQLLQHGQRKEEKKTLSRKEYKPPIIVVIITVSQSVIFLHRLFIVGHGAKTSQHLGAWWGTP